MPNISVFSGAFCKGDSVVREVFEEIALKLVTDNDLMQRAAELSGMGTEKLERHFRPRPPYSNKFITRKSDPLPFSNCRLPNCFQNRICLYPDASGI